MMSGHSTALVLWSSAIVAGGCLMVLNITFTMLSQLEAARAGMNTLFATTTRMLNVT